jgi:acyl carrier protein
MGLDTVELVMEVEESFDITIPDSEASRIVTAGDLLQCVMRHLGQEESGICLSSAAFYKLRSALMSTFSVSRSSIRPASHVAEFLPIATRRHDWDCLGQSLGMRLPNLERPSWLSAMIRTSFLSSLVLVLASVVFGVYTLLLALACFATGILVLKVTRAFQRQFVSDCQTMRGLTLSLLHMNYIKFAELKGSISHVEIWDTLKAIIVGQLGVKPEEVTEDASFVKDFGAD